MSKRWEKGRKRNWWIGAIWFWKTVEWKVLHAKLQMVNTHGNSELWILGYGIRIKEFCFIFLNYFSYFTNFMYCFIARKITSCCWSDVWSVHASFWDDTSMCSMKCATCYAHAAMCCRLVARFRMCGFNNNGSIYVWQLTIVVQKNSKKIKK